MRDCLPVCVRAVDPRRRALRKGVLKWAEHTAAALEAQAVGQAAVIQMAIGTKGARTAQISRAVAALCYCYRTVWSYHAWCGRATTDRIRARARWVIAGWWCLTLVRVWPCARVWLLMWCMGAAMKEALAVWVAKLAAQKVMDSKVAISLSRTSPEKRDLILGFESLRARPPSALLLRCCCATAALALSASNLVEPHHTCRRTRERSLPIEVLPSPQRISPP